MPYALRKLSAAVVLVLAVASCSSSDDTTTSAADKPTSTIEVSVSTTVAPEGAAPSTTISAELNEASSSGDIDVFCGLFQDRVDGLATFVADGDALLDPVAFEAFADQQLLLLEQAQPPAEIAADVEQALVDARLDHELFADNGFDAAKIFQTQLRTPMLSPSNPALESFVADECGIERSGEPTPSAATLGSPAEIAGDAEALRALLETESGRQAIVTQMSEMLSIPEDDARCLVDTVDLTNITALSGEGQLDPEVLIEVFEALKACEIPLTALSLG